MFIDIGLGLFFGLFLFRSACGGVNNVPSVKWWKSSTDSTDDAINNKKSGLALFIDYGTGCHYIQTSTFQPLTPRVDRDGNHVCEPIKQ